jgi:CRP-like cAMP-binding protein
MDELLSFAQQHFFYTLMHAENVAIPKKGIERFNALKDFAEQILAFAQTHRGEISRCGRLPYRNEALWKETTGEERPFLVGELNAAFSGQALWSQSAICSRGKVRILTPRVRRYICVTAGPETPQPALVDFHTSYRSVGRYSMQSTLTPESKKDRGMPRTNALIGSIETEVWSKFEDRFTPVVLERGETLQQPGETVSQVQFPTTAVIVMGVETLAGESVNVALLGPDGAVGVLEACGSRQSYCRATVQFGGKAWQTSAATYRALYDSSSALRIAIHKHMEMLLVESRQNVACNALHSVENRLARTLLEASDKCGSMKLPITQVALAHLLGVQRTTVAAALSALQRAGCVVSGRSSGLEIKDYRKLETLSCSCRDSLTYARKDIQSRTVTSCDA